MNETSENKIESELKCVPFFWSSQFGKNIRFSGYSDEFDAIVFHESKEETLKFAAFYLLANKVIGVCTLDWDPICAVFAEAMYNKIEVKLEHIESDPSGLRKLLV